MYKQQLLAESLSECLNHPRPHPMVRIYVCIGDIYIMMHVCLFVCHEKSSLPLQVCDFLSENVWVKIFFF